VSQKILMKKFLSASDDVADETASFVKGSSLSKPELSSSSLLLRLTKYALSPQGNLNVFKKAFWQFFYFFRIL